MEHETVIRFGVFASVLLVMMAWEALSPRRPRHLPRWLRWLNNLGIVALDSLVIRLAFPLVATGAALLAAEQGFGLMQWLSLPLWLQVLVCVVLLDLVIYGQHVVFHKVPWLWRLHRMHHADPEIDVTTALRFHPLEMVLSMGIKIGVVMVLGAPVLAVILFEVILNATAMFNHANIRLPLAVDRLVRLVFVTPDMHRVHHSVIHQETDSNYGFNLSVWDRLFGTYIAQPREGHDAMTIGLHRFRSAREQWLDRMLIQPASGPASDPDPDGERDADQPGQERT